MSQCQWTPLNLSCSLLLKLPMIEAGRLKWGKTSLEKLSENIPEAVAIFMIEPTSKSNKKIINN